MSHNFQFVLFNGVCILANEIKQLQVGKVFGFDILNFMDEDSLCALLDTELEVTAAERIKSLLHSTAVAHLEVFLGKRATVYRAIFDLAGQTSWKLSINENFASKNIDLFK
jgi:hypothetical protein